MRLLNTCDTQRYMCTNMEQSGLQYYLLFYFDSRETAIKYIE